MKAEALFRLAGVAAILGGAARIFSVFPWTTDAITREALYDVIDALLLFGVIGIYLERRERLGVLGFIAFVAAVGALSFIGGPDADPFGFSTYQEGAAALLVALLGLSLAWLRGGEKPLAPPILWFASAIAAGVMHMLPPPLPDYGVAAAGIFFGLAFVAAGLHLARRA
jgi:hypothetical protein